MKNDSEKYVRTARKNPKLNSLPNKQNTAARTAF
jgi:hypothetical protein